MYGTIGQVIQFASMGAPTAQKMVQSVFGPAFQTPHGWANFLDRHIPMRDVEILLRRSPGFWNRENFQALYAACWIFHPVEKGSYMIQLGAQEYANVKGAYERLLGSGDLQARISSHLSKKGASAHEGWAFLQGYGELLVQIEGEQTGAPYLFLKCEGHPSHDRKKSTRRLLTARAHRATPNHASTSRTCATAHSKSSRGVTSGGASRMTLSCVSLHSSPRSISASQ